MANQNVGRVNPFGEGIFGAIGPGEVYEGAVELKPARLTPEFPSNYFTTAGTKPKITVLKSAPNTNLRDLVYGGLTHGQLEIDVAVEYLIATFAKMEFTLGPEGWTSYGQAIGAANAVITPLNLLEVETKDRTAPAPGDSVPYQGSDLALVTGLTCLYRMALLYGRNAHADYIQAIRSRMTALLESSEVGGRHGVGLLPAIIPRVKDWCSNRSFRACMAALDMFLHKDEKSPWQLARMGSLVSRGKDCAALGDLQRLARCLGTTPQRAVLWVFETSMIPEIQWISAPTEELGKADSYYHYSSDLGLTIRSPWSGTTCKQLHLWTNSICILLQSTEAMQTRHIECENIAGIVSNAVVVAYANRGASEARRIYYATRGEAATHAANLAEAQPIGPNDDPLADLEDDAEFDIAVPDGMMEPVGRKVEDWANFMFSCDWLVPNHMNEWARKKLVALKAPRAGSNLEFLRKFFGVTD
ncbi:MAG: nucleocapsid [Yushu Rhabd tick virus 2]|uniref:Nucleoprotein n=1 Tax=Yushu Rhabd tick virus 2 TaxID=2972332 RepID=A0A9E7V2B4_9RHAB|nr:MAG: nucleocapsid [Yushu Rhabd tick virus 2]